MKGMREKDRKWVNGRENRLGDEKDLRNERKEGKKKTNKQTNKKQNKEK